MKINYKNGYTVEVLDGENESLDDIVTKAYGAMRHTKTINDAAARYSARKAEKVSDSATFGKKTKKVSDSATFGKKTKKISDSATPKKAKKISDSATPKKAKAKDSFTKAFGLPDVEHIVYGDRPGQDELRYGGKIYDYDEIKEQVLDIYLEENENGKVPTDEVLAEWVMSDVANQHAVYHILDVTQPLEEEIEYCVSED